MSNPLSTAFWNAWQKLKPWKGVFLSIQENLRINSFHVSCMSMYYGINLIRGRYLFPFILLPGSPSNSLAVSSWGPLHRHSKAAAQCYRSWFFSKSWVPALPSTASLSCPCFGATAELHNPSLIPGGGGWALVMAVSRRGHSSWGTPQTHTDPARWRMTMDCCSPSIQAGFYSSNRETVQATMFYNSVVGPSGKTLAEANSWYPHLSPYPQM